MTLMWIVGPEFGRLIRNICDIKIDWANDNQGIQLYKRNRNNLKMRFFIMRYILH